MALSDWMAAYQDRRLGEMHLPGSHDAGTTKDYIDKTAFGTDSNSATQTLTINQQLMAGTRFFDLRLAASDGKVVAHHTTKGQGAYSSLSVDRVLEGAALWCSVHKTEVVIFRISHTSLGTNAHEIAKASGKGSLHTGTGNLCHKTLGEIVSHGGGLICIFDEAKFATAINQSQGIHGYSKYRNGVVNDRGIATCGVYSGTHKLSQVVSNGLMGQFLHNQHHNPNRHDHLWQVYWQKTYVNPVSKTGIERGTTKGVSFKGGKVHGGTHAATDYMLTMMQGLGRQGTDYKVQEEESHREGFTRKKVIDKPEVLYSTLPVRNFTLPNILSYDFVNATTNQKIIDLNTQSLMSMEDVDF